MRLRQNLKHFRWVITVALLAYAASPAGAQPAGTGTPAAGGAAGGSGASDAQVGFQRKTQLSPQEQVVESDRSIQRMEQAAAGVRKQLQSAREARDVVKTLCLNDKLSQIDVATRSARDRKTSLQAAATRNDAELSNHEFTILTVLRQRAEQLTAEANQCIGEEAAFIGDTKVTTTVDPTLPASDDTNFPPTDPTLISGPPQCTSCER
jgi:hypothetical protein